MQAKQTIDDYAQSMFRFEHLNETWIHRCAGYLQRIFGERIKGRVVLDYAFGRGNWSLAFLAAGAEKVIAVDAAETNVRRLANYSKERNIDALEVIEGDILHAPLACRADILWIYGILPCVSQPQLFLSAISSLARGEDAASLLYAYNAGSLRQIIVELGRKGHAYRSYDEFLTDSFLFNPAARRRARDDLTAPVAQFHSSAELWELATRAGHGPLEFVPSFERAEGTETPEFSAHHLHCRLSKVPSEAARYQQAATGQKAALPIDLQIIQQFGQDLMDSCSRETAKKMAIGLFNTHFAALQSGGYERCLTEDCLFLLYAYLVRGLSPRTELQALVLDMSHKALKGEPRPPATKHAEESSIIRFLAENRIRL